ncbi:MAG TPA: ABC transporter ATP-binding protein [Candidatus Copromonas faecavium]|uniref:ABC transporter ATP-binding protein n=1 Tax=Candidatus Copromonas faecavium (nom. illeg.) TaxID=2840740 RepID=A0A9D1A546_9FIRM|nr:ABC transporter ATP-binding protein [Candidatus Copromonas faecavium]
MAEIVFEQVSKSFGNTKVIENLNLTIRDGAFTVLLGPSGCGKTTLLRMIAGIGPATSGTIYMDGEDISAVPPGKRNVAMVFQNYAIYPTMSVRKNIEFCLENNRVPKKERKERVERVANIVGLEEYLDRKPSQLSGGQRQRVALARAMVKEPAVFLMDEPLSNLDAKLRSAMRSELIQLHRQLKTTFVYVTHDQVESMAMADEIVLMNEGKIMQKAAPEVIYHDPENIFTAQFIGTPPANVLPAKDGDGFIGYRPEHVKIAGDVRTYQGEEAGEEIYRRDGEIVTREMLGSEVLYKIRIPEGDVMVKSLCFSHEAGDQVSISVGQRNLYLFDRNGERIRDEKQLLGKGL